MAETEWLPGFTPSLEEPCCRSGSQDTDSGTEVCVQWGLGCGLSSSRCEGVRGKGLDGGRLGASADPPAGPGVAMGPQSCFELRQRGMASLPEATGTGMTLGEGSGLTVNCPELLQAAHRRAGPRGTLLHLLVPSCFVERVYFVRGALLGFWLLSSRGASQGRLVG